jgi:hypothetical protein
MGKYDESWAAGARRIIAGAFSAAAPARIVITKESSEAFAAAAERTPWIVPWVTMRKAALA